MTIKLFFNSQRHCYLLGFCFLCDSMTFALFSPAAREDVFVFLTSFSLLSLCVSVGSATVISPLELIRTKLQSQKQSYRELTDCIRSAVETEGWRSLWRGLGPTLFRDVPFSAMYWYNYEKGKSWLCERYNTREPTLTITFISGAVSGSVSASAQHSTCR